MERKEGADRVYLLVETIVIANVRKKDAIAANQIRLDRCDFLQIGIQPQSYFVL